MAIIVDVKPEVEAELARQAAEHGLQIEAHVAGLLEDAANLSANPKRLTLSKLDKAIQELAQFSHKIPVLPDEAFTRESIYQDHD